MTNSSRTDEMSAPPLIQWAVTQNNPRMSHRYEANTSYPRSGWKRHAVRVPEGRDIYGDGKRGDTPLALCGLRPESGWGCDLFEDEMEPCQRCLKSARSKGIPDPVGVHPLDYRESRS